MKIALVSPYDYPYPGGVTEHIAALDQHFRALGHDTRIIAASSKDEEGLDDHVIKVSGAVSTVPFSGSNARITFAPAVYRRVKQNDDLPGALDVGTFRPPLFHHLLQKIQGYGDAFQVRSSSAGEQGLQRHESKSL